MSKMQKQFNRGRIVVLEQLDIHMVQNESWLSPHSNIGSKWIIDLNIEAKSRKWIEENTGDNLHGVRKNS